MVQLQIPVINPFQPHGFQKTKCQRWHKWKKNFTYFLTASRIAANNRKKT